MEARGAQPASIRNRFCLHLLRFLFPSFVLCLYFFANLLCRYVVTAYITAHVNELLLEDMLAMGQKKRDTVVVHDTFSLVLYM